MYVLVNVKLFINRKKKEKISIAHSQTHSMTISNYLTHLSEHFSFVLTVCGCSMKVAPELSLKSSSSKANRAHVARKEQVCVINVINVINIIKIL